MENRVGNFEVTIKVNEIEKFNNIYYVGGEVTEVKENYLEKETLQKLKESVQTLEGIEGLLCVEMEENLTSGYDLVFYSEFETSVKELKNSISANKKEDTLEDLINELENN